MSRQLIHELVNAEPAVWPVLLRFLRTRLLDRLLATSPLFQQFDRGERDELIRKFRFLEVAAGTPLVAQGAPTPGLFLLMAGHAEVARDGARVAVLGPGDLFGEMSLLGGDVAGAAVTAHSKCLLLLLPVADFRRLTMTHPQVVAFLSELADQRVQGASDVGHVELL
ncbi:MAG: cyclic nucleotide-binding domain-containing protein [Myxococcales bacterium]|nr:cyclic nucleotide-binding domain-containing protein [Myxococcales bacterium]